MFISGHLCENLFPVSQKSKQYARDIFFFHRFNSEDDEATGDFGLTSFRLRLKFSTVKENIELQEQLSSELD